MTAALYILARGDGDGFELVMIVLIVVVMFVVSIIKKVAASRAEEARRERPQQRPQQQPRQQQPRRPEPGRTARPAGPPPAPPQVSPDVEMAQQALRAMGLIPARPQPSEVEEAVVLTPAEPESVRVGEELEQEHRRQRSAEAQRRKRLARRKVPEAHLAAIEGTILQVRPGQGPRVTVPTGPSVDLSSAARARRAIVFHEIFSAPKALRQGKEMWDV